MDRTAFFFLALSAAACGAGKPEAPTSLGSSPSPGDSGGTEATRADGPTWHSDIAPMLATQCTRCHYAGGLGPADFSDLSTVRALAPAMRGAMEDRQMPPPASDPSCQDYKGSDHLVLSDTDRGLFSSWVDAGMPEGDPDTAREVPPIKDTLDAPDIVLQMESPYRPAFTDTENPGNEYRCFALDPGELAGRTITSMAPVVGNNEMVHHIVLFSLPSTSLSEEQRAPGGWDCIDTGNTGSIDGMVSAWAPGMLPIEFPEGTGLPVAEDRHLVMQIHYFYNGPETDGASDQSGYAFEVSPEGEPVTSVFLAPAGTFSFEIPAGADEHTVTDSFYNSYVPLQLLGMFPHMHHLGTRFSARIKHADGGETCLVDGDYSFDNQMTYQFHTPIELAQGDHVEFSCTWDNSEGTAPVGYGERTDEEMCFFFTFLTL